MVLVDRSGPGNCTCVACLSRVCHQGVFVELSRLVIGGLEDGSSSHGRLGRRDQREVLARDSQENLPEDVRLVLHDRAKTERIVQTHMLADNYRAVCVESRCVSRDGEMAYRFG